MGTQSVLTLAWLADYGLAVAGHGTLRRCAAVVLALGAVSALAVSALAATTVTPRDAVAVAVRINLRDADLTASMGWSSSPPPPPATVHQEDASLPACYGGVPYRDVLADVLSPLFVGGTGLDGRVSSEVVMYASPALAARDFAAFDTARGRGCALADLGMYADAHIRRVASERVAVLPASPAGTGGMLATRYTLGLVVTGVKRIVNFVEDEYVFTSGQAEVLLAVDAQSLLAIIEPSQSVERRLLALLISRARTLLEG